MKTSFVNVTSISFILYVHRIDGKKRFHKNLRRQEKYLRKCGLIEVDMYVEGVVE